MTRAAEWHAARVGKITGSRIAKVLSLSPYGDAESVLREMVRECFGDPVEFQGSWATDRGQDGEDKALTAYESRYTVMVHGGGRFVPHPTIEWLQVEPDGLVRDDGLVEAKYPPPRARYTRVDERPDYETQIRLQLECAGRDWGDLAVYKDGSDVDAPIDDRRLFVSRVEHDPAWLPSVLDVLGAFHEKFLRVIGSEKMSAPYRTALRVDAGPEYLDAEVAYADAMAELAAADEQVKQRRARLIDLSEGRTVRGRYYQVTHATRKGSTDYAQAAKDWMPEDGDLEKYRKPATKVISVNPVGAKR